MEYKICKLSWTGDKYAVLSRAPGGNTFPNAWTNPPPKNCIMN